MTTQTTKSTPTTTDTKTVKAETMKAKPMDVTTASKTRENADEPDPYAVAEEAADAFMTALRTAIERLPQRPDLTEPAEALRRALDRLCPGSAEPVLAAAYAALNTSTGRRPELIPSLDALRGRARNEIPAVLRALDHALTVFERQSELDEAERTLARLEAERRSVLSDAEAAVAAADVDSVLALRPRIEIELPAALDAARLAVAELHLARAQAEQRRPHQRAEAAARVEAQVCADLEEARRRLEAAGEAAQAAARDKALADQLAKVADAETQRLALERDRLAAANKASLQDRLRRLAGLPPEESAEVEQIEDSRTKPSHPVRRPLAIARGVTVTMGPVAS
ncbi:hypothetical protein [Geodermatophilus sp. URMC 60]